MAKIKRVPRCYHCGMVLQSTNPEEKGYVSPEVLNREVPVQIIYCDACYHNLMEFNETAKAQVVDEQILKILDDAVASDALIVWVVDLFSFNGVLNAKLAKKVKNNKVLVVGTKRDLFSKSIKDENFVEYLTKRFEKYGVKPCAVKLIGNSDNMSAQKAIGLVQELRQGHDVFMIGNQSSGKTSLINKVLKFYVNKTKRVINTHLYPETEVNVLEIPLTRSATFYELPGISQTSSLVGMVEKDVYKMIVPKKAITMFMRTMTAGEALVVGSLAYFEIVKGKTLPYKFFSSEFVETKKVSAKNAQKTIIENYSSKAIRPVSNRFSTFRDYDLYDITMENDGKQHDIVIEGLCWLSFPAKGQTIRVQAPKGVAVNELLAKVK